MIDVIVCVVRVIVDIGVINIRVDKLVRFNRSVITSFLLLVFTQLWPQKIY